jgi:hypothetical protein
LFRSGENMEGLELVESDIDLLFAARDLVREHPTIARFYAGERARERLVP